MRGTIEELLSYIEDQPIKGECCFLVEGSTGIQEETIKIVGSLKEQVEQLIAEGKKTNEAIKAVAVQNGLKKQEVYRQFHELDEE